MKKYLFIVLLVWVCFGQTIADLNAEQKLQYNRNKLSIDVVQKTRVGGYGNTIAGWNQWTAYQGLRNKITEYKFLLLLAMKMKLTPLRKIILNQNQNKPSLKLCL